MTVVLRSYQGMTNSFSWNQTVQTGLILTGATALGKLSGGIVADLAGVKKAVVFSLGGGDLFRGNPVLHSGTGDSWTAAGQVSVRP